MRSCPAILCALSAVAAAARAGVDIPEGFYWPEGSRWVGGLSENGKVVVETHDGVFLWSFADGYGDKLVPEARALNADGTVVVGKYASDRAFRWTTTNGYHEIEEPRPTPQSEATALSAAGSVVACNDLYYDTAFWWTVDGGPRPVLGLGRNSYAEVYAVSREGDFVAGTSYSDFSGKYEAFRESSLGVPHSLGVFQGHEQSIVRDISADGEVYVGMGASGHFREAFRWTEDEGFEFLGSLGETDGFIQGSMAYAASADGSVIIGSQGGRQSFIWDERHGIRDLASVIEARGFDLTGWDLDYALYISDDGSTIAGNGRYYNANRAWIAVIPSPGGAAVLTLAALLFAARRRYPS